MKIHTQGYVNYSKAVGIITYIKCVRLILYTSNKDVYAMPYVQYDYMLSYMNLIKLYYFIIICV